MTNMSDADVGTPHTNDVVSLPNALSLEALRAHEPRACQRFWETHASLVRGLLRRSLGWHDEDDVEGVVQQVFLTTFQNLHKVQQIEDLRSFLVGVTMNHARNTLRARKRRRARFSSAPVHVEPSGPGGAHGHVALSRLHDLLDGLSHDLRLAFVLRHVEGLEVQQVADALDISHSTAKRRIAKSRKLIVSWARKDPWLQEYLQE